MSTVDALKNRLSAYRAFLEQVLFGGALFGMVIVFHLFIQQTRDFDRGCFGFSALDKAGQVGFDCSAVVSSGAGTFLGLSNITWGFGFYGAIALLTLAIFSLAKRGRPWLHAARAGLLTSGVVYSGYLVYVQVQVVEALCALCLLSAVTAAVLFALQVAILTGPFESVESTMSTRLFKRDLTIYVYLAAFAMVLVGADFTYFQTLSSSEDARASTQQEQYDGAACKLDAEKAPVEDPSSLVNFEDVTKGASDASVTIVEYFDPNCPHCKTFHDTMKKLVSAYDDEVQFVFKPFPLRGSSLPEIQALYAAHKEGKFADMLEAQYARQGRSGITKQDLREIASEIGMDPDVLMSRIEDKKYRKQVVEQRKRAIEIGVESTPTVLINGHFAGSRSLECMKMFIERAKSGELGGTDA